MKKTLLAFLASSVLLLGSMALIANAAPVTPIYGGGTGTSTIPANGYLLEGNGTGYIFIPSSTFSGGGGNSTTTINGFSGSVFQILAGNGVTSTITNGSTTFTLNLGSGCSGNNFVSTISPTGTISCATPSGGSSSTVVTGISPIVVSQVGINATTSCPTCLTSAIQTLDGLTTSTITLATSTSAGTWTITTSNGNTITFTIPPAHDQYFAPSTTIPTTYVSTFNGASGAITYSSPATSTITASGTTLNGPSFTFASSSTVLPYASGTALYWTILTNGNWTGTWQNATSGTYYPASNPSNFISTSTGLTVANFGSSNISQWTNNSGYITTSTNNFGGLTNASVTALSPILWSTTSTISCPTCITSIPSQTVYLASTTNWASGNIAVVSSSNFLASFPASSTATFYVDSNRNDSYTVNGSWLFPYQSLSAAIASSTGFSCYAYYLSPGTYVDGAPDNFPSCAYLAGNQSTYVPASGATFPGAFDIYDITVAGNLTSNDTSTASIHQIQNSSVTGNWSCAGNCLANNVVFPTTTSTITTNIGSIDNFAGDFIESNIVNNGGTVNLNDDEQLINATNTKGWAYFASSTGSFLNINGLTEIVLATGTRGINVANSGATSTPNNLNAFSITVNTSTAGSTITAGSAATELTNVTSLTNQVGTFIAPSGTVWSASYDENKVILNAFSVGTSTNTTGDTILADSVFLPLLSNTILGVNGSGQIVATTTTAGGGSGNLFVTPTSTVLANNFPFYITAASSTVSATSVISQVGTTGLNVTGTLSVTTTTTIGSGQNQFQCNPSTTKCYVEAGSSTVASTVGGTLAYSATSTGNGAGASTTIETFNIPSSTYLTVGDEVDFYVGGTYANSAATNKQVQVAIASSTVFDTGASFAPANAACNWFLEGRGMATKAIPGTATATTTILWTSQYTDSCQNALTDDSGDAGNATVTATTTSPINITVYGNGTNASDTIANYFRIQYNPF